MVKHKHLRYSRLHALIGEWPRLIATRQYLNNPKRIRQRRLSTSASGARRVEHVGISTAEANPVGLSTTSAA
ncbi:MAG: hypothetical protein ACP5G4_05610 [bacterium]